MASFRMQFFFHGIYGMYKMYTTYVDCEEWCQSTDPDPIPSGDMVPALLHTYIYMYSYTWKCTSVRLGLESMQHP